MTEVPFAMRSGSYAMDSQDAPPGFWESPGDGPPRIDGIEIVSGVPTRFFQTLDTYPREWGRLSWRVQLNKLVDDRAVSPFFRTFYPGVEWNLNRPDYRWFLTAWFVWAGTGPPYRAPANGPPRLEGDTALFPFAWAPHAAPPGSPDAAARPDLDRPLFLRSRVDARDRRRISEALRSERAAEIKPDPELIVLDDLIDGSG